MTKRPVLILGARSDIGMAVAHRFAREGHGVQLAARNPETLDKARQDIALRYQVAASLHAYDAVETGAIDAFFDGLPEVPGIVVSAVGILGDQAETEGNPVKVAQVIATNFIGPMMALEAAARRLAALDEPAAIIGITSIAGDRGRAKNYWYGSAKAAFSAALSGLRQKYARTKVHVMTVKPGFVYTRMTEGMDLPKAMTDTPEGIADLIYRAWRRRQFVVYPFKWWAAMSVIRLIPEALFRKMKF